MIRNIISMVSPLLSSCKNKDSQQTVLLPNGNNQCNLAGLRYDYCSYDFRFLPPGKAAAVCKVQGDERAFVFWHLVFLFASLFRHPH